MRSFGRGPDGPRPIRLTRHFQPYAEGSILIETGNTKVICSASVEERVPPFLKDKGLGWVTAEYSMLPRSTLTRVSRERANSGGRSAEIQRFVGRSLRATVDTSKLGPRTITIDCDVLQADGGTRTAAISGGMAALVDACAWLRARGLITEWPLTHLVAAISVGVVDGVPLLDLDYEEDVRAHVDMNVAARSDGTYVEVQGTAEKQTFDRPTLDRLLDLAGLGTAALFQAQRACLSDVVEIQETGNRNPAA
ncbi:MAG TPA: ribonuclease PH [Candidatus Xenobia bacterium]